MDEKTVKSLIYKSAHPPLKKIVSKNLKNSEQIENETRIIIDLNIVYSEIKNSIESIVDYLVDRFKILDKDKLTKNLVIHIYSDSVKECILKINKIVSDSDFKDVADDEKNKYLVNYLVDQLIICIFNEDVRSILIDLSENKSNNFINLLVSNWKILLTLFLIMIMILFIRKSYLYLKNL